MDSINLKYKQPRESRLIAGVVIVVLGIGVSFFSTLVALESFTENPIVILIFLISGIIMIVTGLYFSLCIPIMEIDKNNKVIILAKSCLIFQTKTIEPFRKIREVGIKELYHAGDRSEETGTSYYVEVRTKENLEVPGSKNRDLNSTAQLANDIASSTGAKFNPKLRKVFTGSFKLK